MNDFFKRNLVWIAILLCIAGVVLSIVGIPTGNPIFFFIGIVLSIPTIGFLIYQVFFRRDEPEISLAPTGNKASTSNITSIIADKNDILLQDKLTDEDDLEPFYSGYANQQEIDQRLREVTENERNRAMIELPEITLPEATPSTNNFDNYISDYTDEIENTTNNELLHQREAVTTASNTFTTEIPVEITEQNITSQTTATPDNQKSEVISPKESEQPQTYTIDIDDFDDLTTNPEIIKESNENESTIGATPTTSQSADNGFDPEAKYIAPTLDDPNFNQPYEVVMPQNTVPLQSIAESKKLTPIDLTNATVIRVNAKNAELRKQRAQEKKTMLSQHNLERYLRRYFIETAACFLMDRTMYKDKNGIAPYNKYAINKVTNLPEYTISATKGRLYKFCTYLIDAERFITHQVLYNDFITEIEHGTSLARISETLHPLYRKKYKKDFILNLSNREDWDNVIILVYNNYILNNDNFKDVFTHLPFEIPFAYNDENIIDYLKDTDIQDCFAERYSALEEMGVPTFWEALYICFINSIKQKLTIAQIESALLREYKKIARSLKRIDNTRRKTLRNAS